jgi:carbamoyltransferase
VRGEPIVCTPEDAYRCFLATEMDALVLENFIVLKSQLNGVVADEKTRAKYLAQFRLD